MAKELTLEAGWLARDVAHAAYDVAVRERKTAEERLARAQRALDEAKRGWEAADYAVQKAFAALR